MGGLLVSSQQSAFIIQHDPISNGTRTQRIYMQWLSLSLFANTTALPDIHWRPFSAPNISVCSNKLHPSSHVSSCYVSLSVRQRTLHPKNKCIKYLPIVRNKIPEAIDNERIISFGTLKEIKFMNGQLRHNDWSPAARTIIQEQVATTKMKSKESHLLPCCETTCT